MENKLSEILAFIKAFGLEHGYPPSVREICKGVNIPSTASVYTYLKQLEELGKIVKSPSKNRAIEIKDKYSDFGKKETVEIPLIGTIAAGVPIDAVENIEEVYPLPRELFRSGELFMLTVKGESMTGAGIYDGDKIIIRRQTTAENGEIIAALTENGATVKRFYKQNGKFILRPENPAMKDIIVGEVNVLGVAAGLIRKF